MWLMGFKVKVWSGELNIAEEPDGSGSLGGVAKIGVKKGGVQTLYLVYGFGIESLIFNMMISSKQRDCYDGQVIGFKQLAVGSEMGIYL